ncbi:MAG: hypothetical protein GX937_10860 [Lentisphaerae bacterium]|jgi:predicted permease|nr:hypothetical protein [Lentisphaerota bacterium]
MSFTQQFSVIFVRLFAICLMLAAGYYARRRDFLNDDSTRRMSMLVTNLLYPAAIFASLVSKFTLRGIAAEWVLPVGAFLIIVIGYCCGLLFGFLSRGYESATRRMFHFQCSLTNYVFLPLPLVLVFWPETGLGKLALSSIGSEIGVWTFGILALTGASFRLGDLKKLLSAPMLAILLSIIVLAFREAVPLTFAEGSLWLESWRALISVGETLGAATVPLAMIIAGSRMATLRIRNLSQPLQFWLLLLRLIVIPAITAPLLLWMLPLGPESRFIILLIAVMPCSVASVALSEIYHADTDFAAASVLLTTVACILTVPFWMAALG